MTTRSVYWKIFHLHKVGRDIAIMRLSAIFHRIFTAVLQGGKNCFFPTLSRCFSGIVFSGKYWILLNLCGYFYPQLPSFSNWE